MRQVPRVLWGYENAMRCTYVFIKFEMFKYAKTYEQGSFFLIFLIFTQKLPFFNLRRTIYFYTHSHYLWPTILQFWIDTSVAHAEGHLLAWVFESRCFIAVLCGPAVRAASALRALSRSGCARLALFQFWCVLCRCARMLMHGPCLCTIWFSQQQTPGISTQWLTGRKGRAWAANVDWTPAAHCSSARSASGKTSCSPSFLTW